MDELKYLKKHYGEKFAHYCRDNFPTLLENEGLLTKLIESKFPHSKILYKDIVEQEKTDDFKSFIFSMVDVERLRKEQKSDFKSAEEIMLEAGYILFPECKTEKEIQSFKKYYAKEEELCTFNGGRLDSCRVWFAVKEDVDKIKRKNFPNPKRQDEYGTSVISIQFSRSGNYLSIKNRYNHTVNNPDATFNNDLDNIHEGLADAFERDFGCRSEKMRNGFELTNYVVANDGKFYKYNFEIDNIYYCANNIVIDNGKITRYPERYVLADNYLFDLSTNRITLEYNMPKDAFIISFGEVEKIYCEKNEKGQKVLQAQVKEGEDCFVTLGESNEIVAYFNPNVKEIGDNFLLNNKSLSELSLPNLQTVGKGFLCYNRSLTKLNLPQLQSVGDDFLLCNGSLSKLNLPELQSVGDNFLLNNKSLSELSLPNLQTVGKGFLRGNDSLTKLSLPKLQSVEDGFLLWNGSLSKLSLPKLQSVGDGFLARNKSLKELILPELQTVGDYFLNDNDNKRLTELSLPNLKRVGYYFLFYNECLTKMNLPSLQTVGGCFFYHNKSLTKLSLPKLKKVDNSFLFNNKALTELSLPKLQSAGSDFLSNNNSLTELSLPKLQSVGDDFLGHNYSLTELSLPKLKSRGVCFLEYNDILRKKIYKEMEERDNKSKEK